MLRNTALRVFAVIVIVATTSCTSAVPTYDPPRFPDRVFNGPWAMEARARESFKKNVNAINIGDDIRDVIKLLGPPGSDAVVAKNEKLRFFHYILTRQHADSPIESDEVVSIVFNKHNKVDGIISNVNGIPSRNFPYKLNP